MSASSESMRNVTIRMPPELIDRVDEVRKQGEFTIPKSQIIRVAVEEKVEELAE